MLLDVTRGTYGCEVDRIRVQDVARTWRIEQALVQELPCDVRSDPVRIEDVNFDGMPDLAISDQQGIVSGGRRFWFWLGQRGGAPTPATALNDAGVVGPEFDATRQVVVSHERDGSAGTIERELRWQGDELVEVRCTFTPELPQLIPGYAAC